MLSIFQQCEQADGWAVIDVPSSSNPDEVHRVAISDWDAMCDCKGWLYRQECSHVRTARSVRCRWEEGETPAQTEEQRMHHICPACGGKTRIAVREM